MSLFLFFSILFELVKEGCHSFDCCYFLTAIKNAKKNSKKWRKQIEFISFRILIANRTNCLFYSLTFQCQNKNICTNQSQWIMSSKFYELCASARTYACSCICEWHKKYVNNSKKWIVRTTRSWCATLDRFTFPIKRSIVETFPFSSRHHRTYKVFSVITK